MNSNIFIELVWSRHKNTGIFMIIQSYNLIPLTMYTKVKSLPANIDCLNQLKLKSNLLNYNLEILEK
jgi:hypothetical protein